MMDLGYEMFLNVGKWINIYNLKYFSEIKIRNMKKEDVR